MGKGRICIWIIRPVVTAPAFLPLQRCPGDQSADLCQIFQLYQFSQTPSRSAAGDLRLQICQLRQVLLKSGLAADNHQGFVRALLQGLQQVSAFPSGAGGQLLQPPGDLSCRRLSSWVSLQPLCIGGSAAAGNIAEHLTGNGHVAPQPVGSVGAGGRLSCRIESRETGGGMFVDQDTAIEGMGKAGNLHRIPIEVDPPALCATDR